MTLSRWLIVILVAALCTPAEAQTVYMEATGTVTSAPDMATIAVGISAKAKTTEATMASSAKTTGELMSALKLAGVLAKDIRTSQFDFGADTARPNYNNTTDDYVPEEKVVGYHLNTTVEVDLHDLKAIDALISKIIAVGATSIDRVAFSVEDPVPLYDEARAKAFARAQVKADIYAKAAGRSLGDLVSIREGVGFDPEKMVQIAYPYSGDDAADLAVVTPVQGGELDFSVSVSSVWNLLPK